MERSASRGRNALLTTAGILVAVALVAIAARGSTSAGEAGSRRPTDTLLDILLSLYIVALVAGAFLFLYLLLLQRKSLADGGKSAGLRDWKNWIGVVVMVSALMLVARDLPSRRIGDPGLTLPQTGGGGGIPTEQAGGGSYEPDFAWIPVLVTLALVGLAAAGAWWAGKARRRARGERPFNPFAAEIAAAVDVSLDDLRAEPDPRRAVIAAYARLERVLASHRLPRRPSEAPLEYLERMLAEASVSAHAARALTRLFERAKFSQHAVGAEMKTEAIAALERVRDDLLAATALAEQEREAARA
jgi:hypothetical protein